MKTTPLFLIGVLALFPVSALAAALHDGSDLYMQSVLETGIDTTIGATTSNDVRVEAEIRVEGVHTAGSVATEADLAAYSAELESSNMNVDRAEAQVDGEVVVSYYHPVTLLGIFATRMKSETTVKINQEGMVEAKTRLPWWSFLTTDAGSTASSIDAELSNSGEITTDMKLSGDAAARARVLETVLETHARAMVRASSY